MNGKLEGKVVIVTGAAKGIGYALARGCCSEGAAVVLCDVDLESLQKAVDDLKKDDFVCEGKRLDVTVEKDIRDVFSDVFQTYGHIDGLINNAGIASKVGFLESTLSDFEKVIRVNLMSVYLCSREAASYMTEQRKGSIVNIASVAAHNGGGLMGTSLYAASKGAVISFSKGIARELAPFGVRVNSIAPASIDTPMTTVGRNPAEYAATIKKIPLGRRGKPEKVVGPAVLLLSDESSFMVGVTLDVNGGVYMY